MRRDGSGDDGRGLAGCVALVTGGSRGVGRGIAHELGLAGAMVFVTGRSREEGESTDGLPGTVDGTARLVTEGGGRGVPVVCDHTVEGDVDRLVDRLREETGRLDLLVNNVWGGYEDYDPDLWQLPFWEQPVWRWDKMWETGVRAHYLTARATAPLLLESDRPLIVEISAGDDGEFLGDVQYDLAKAACNRLGFALAEALEDEGITSLTVWPGFTRTERVEAMASEEALKGTHSPRFVGRAVAALASDPDVEDRSGGAYKVGHLARDYGFRDVDGSLPEPWSLPDG